MPLLSTSKVKSLIGSGATSSGGRTGVLLPQAEKTKREIAIERRKPEITGTFLRLLVFDSRLRTLASRLWFSHVTPCTLHLALINQSTATVAALQLARYRHTNDDDRSLLLRLNEGKGLARTTARSAAIPPMKAVPDFSFLPDTSAPPHPQPHGLCGREAPSQLNSLLHQSPE